MAPVSTRNEHPIIHGLAALVGVAVAIGLLFGVGTLAVTKGLGLGSGGSSEASDPEAGEGASMYLPKPTKKETATGPLVSLAPGEEETPGSTGSPQAATGIVLQAGQTSVSPMQQIDLSGSYAGGDGAILQVQRFEGGSWRDFPVTARVSGGQFSTYIQTGQTGENKFRMADTDSGTTSNEVTVTIG
jgi:hypothetical protein